MNVGPDGMGKASGTPVTIASKGAPVRLERINLSEGHYNEAWLQALAFDHPDVLPIAEIERGFGEIVAVAREVPCSAGYIDNLYITGAGDLVLVEAKLWRNPQARREVVAQALDYVAALMACSYEEFENACRKGQGMTAATRHALVAERGDALADADFVDAVVRNLRRGRLLVIVLGDGIRSETEALADLLQSHAGAHFTFALVELTSWLNPVTQEITVPSAPFEMRLKADLLAEFGLPDILYPLPFAIFDAAVGNGGILDFPVLLHALQERSAQAGADWRGYEPALARLAELIAPADDRTHVSAAGPEWWIEIGPVDLTGPIVTIQRGDVLVAAMAAREDGRLRLATYRPLDARSAALIINLAAHPHAGDGTVCVRPNNWEYALDCSVGAGQVYAEARGEPYLSCWTLGIGLQTDGTTLKSWWAMRERAPRPPSVAAIELGASLNRRSLEQSIGHTLDPLPQGQLRQPFSGDP